MAGGTARPRRQLALGARRAQRALLLRPLARRVLALVSRCGDLLSALPSAALHASQCGGMAKVRRLAHHRRRDHRLYRRVGSLPATDADSDALDRAPAPLL